MSDSMTIRPAARDDIPGIAKVHMASWRSTYRGIVPNSYLDNLTLEKHMSRHQRIMSEPGRIYFVAESAEHGIVGFLTGGPNRADDAQYAGELYALYILADHQRKGVGPQLVRAWAERLVQNGTQSALVWAFAENAGANVFYQKLGGLFVREQTIEIDGMHLAEFGYGWNDLNLLIQQIDSRSFYPIEQVARFMQGFPAPWFVCGGWAIDLFLGRVTRSHSDIEIGIYRCDQQRLFDHLPGWSLEKAAGEPDDSWQAWQPGEDLQLPVHQIRARNPDARPMEFEFFLNQRTATHWYSRRHENVTRPVAELSALSDQGIPFLAPDIQLLYKAKYVRPKDQADFDLVLPRLDSDQRRWLADQLLRFHPEGQWVAAIERQTPSGA